MLEEKIQKDLMAAMMAKEELKLNTLRNIKTAITRVRTASGFSGELSDADILNIMQKMVKEREESAVIYDAAGRAELAERERGEAQIISAYLPKPLTEDEIRAAIEEAIAETNAVSIKDMGKVMGVVTKRLSGRADGRTISSIVKSLLK